MASSSALAAPTAEAVEDVIPHMDAVIAGDYETGVAPHWRRWNPGDDEARLRKIDQPQLCDRTIARFIDNEAIGRAAAELTGASQGAGLGRAAPVQAAGRRFVGERRVAPGPAVLVALVDARQRDIHLLARAQRCDGGSRRDALRSRLARLGRADDRRLLPAGDRPAARSDRRARRLGRGRKFRLCWDRASRASTTV